MEIVNENKQDEKVTLSSPLFAVIYDKTRLKMAELEDKNAKLAKKNEKAQVKLERAEYMVKLLKQIKGTPTITKNLPAPFIKLMEMLAKQEQDRFKSLKGKIEKRTNEISCNNKKFAKHNIDLETCVSIDKFVKNLKSPTGKKEIFVEGLQEFNNIAIRKAQNKLADINEKISKASTAKSKTHSASEHVKLDNKIRKLTKQKETLENKIKGFDVITGKINAVQNAPQEKVDKVIEKSCDVIVNAATENPDKFAKNQAETVVEVCSEAIDEELLQSKEQEKSAEKEIVLPEPTPVEYRNNVSEAEIKKLNEANIKFVAVNDKNIKTVLLLNIKRQTAIMLSRYWIDRWKTH